MKLPRLAVSFVLVVVLGATALAASVALLVPASHAILAGASSSGTVDFDFKTPAQRSYVYDHLGHRMTTIFHTDRAPVKLKDVPPQLIDAVLAIEDRKFYEHNGVDLAGSVRAVFKNVDEGRLAQGGSTITQQLIKNTLSVGKKRDAKTKLREMLLAVRLERQLSKNQILEDYLNLVPFGYNASGIESAAERYFNEPMTALTLPQSALLAGLLQAPSDLDPIRHPAASARRRAEVIQAMLDTRKISAAEARAANLSPLPTQVWYPQASERSYYIDAVLNQLSEPDSLDPANPANALGTTKAEARKLLYEGGLRIYTNYDPVMQYLANLAITDIVPKSQSQFTAALVSIDNSNGAVRAVAFGRGYDESQFDPAIDGPGRQAGSAFKGITLAAALSAGYSAVDRVSGSSIRWRLGPGTGSDSYYDLSGDCHGGSPTLTQAIAISDNCAWVRTELSLGPGHYGADGANQVIKMADRMGIDTSEFEPVVSTTLGTNGVHPFEMAQAYSVIAADGVLHPAELVRRIVAPDGKVLYENDSAGTRVLTPEVARTETKMLTEVLKNGTAHGLSIGRPAAGKTGTTDLKADAWFVGYTPELTTAVWMGDPNGQSPMTNVGGIAVYGATYPARIWERFMEAALGNSPPKEFKEPDEKQWPTPQRIDEFGRHYSTYYANPAPVTTTTIGQAPVGPRSTTSVPRVVAPTTAPPVTTPRTNPPKPTVPPTVPPTIPPTVPPTSAPGAVT